MELSTRTTSARGALWLTATCASLVAFAVSRVSHADSWTVAWEAPPGCPTVERVDEMIQEVLQTELEHRPELEARAVVTSDVDGSWTLHLEVEREGIIHRRTLTGNDCREVSEAAALVVALAIDPNALASRKRAESTRATSAPEAAAQPTEQPPSASSQAPERQVAPAPARPAVAQEPHPLESPAIEIDEGGHEHAGLDATRLMLGVDGVADAGSMPAPAVGPAAILALSRARYRLETFGAYLPDQLAYASSESRAAARVRLWFAGLRGCWVLPIFSSPLGGMEAGESSKLGLCGSLEGGAFSARGASVAEAQRRRMWWGGAAAQFAGFFPLAGLVGLRAALGLGVPLNRDYFLIAGAGSAHRPARLFGRGFLGVEARFL